ncbi:unnamed protein product [Cunninghamella blakesleeana]
MTNNANPLKRLVPSFISKNTVRMYKQHLQNYHFGFASNKIQHFRKKTPDMNNNRNKYTVDNNKNTMSDKGANYHYRHHRKKKKRIMTSYLILLPTEILHDIFTHLDGLSLYQLTRVSSYLRYQLQTYSSHLWSDLFIDPNLILFQQDARYFYQCLCFLISFQLHLKVFFLSINHCFYLDQVLLDILIHSFPNLISLSMKQASQIDCWQLLHLLRSIHQKNQQLLEQQQNFSSSSSSSSSFNKNRSNYIVSSTLLLKSLKKMNHPQLKVSLFNKSFIPDTIIPSITSTPSSNYDNTNINQQENNHSSSPPSSSLKFKFYQNQNHQDRQDHQDLQYQLYPCLQYLRKLDIQGAFPSERSYQPYGHEMYCFGEIKKILLQFGHQGKNNTNKNDLSSSIHQQQLTEGHYALYQFWLLLRSRVLRRDTNNNNNNNNNNNQQYNNNHNNNNAEVEEDFRPPWLPETLIQFIQITEHDHPASKVKIDLAPCRLCHRNVTLSSSSSSSSSTIKCQSCQSPTTTTTCHQCKCVSCDAVLCIRCYRRHHLLSREAQMRQQQNNLNISSPSPTPSLDNNNNENNNENENHRPFILTNSSDTNHHHNNNRNGNDQQIQRLTSWKVLRCFQCNFSRRTCGQSSCNSSSTSQDGNKESKNWYCHTCQQKFTKSHKTSSRFFKRPSQV